MSDPSSKLKAESLTINGLMASYFYVVPHNQREYSWRVKEEIPRFWEDLLETINRDRKEGVSVANPVGHYMGAVVVIGGDQGGATDRHKIIDGQQRITTTTCLARVLLEFVDQLGDHELRRRLSNKLMPCIYADIQGEVHPRVILNREHAFYDQSVVRSGGRVERTEYWQSETTEKPAVRSRIRQAIEYFDARVQSDLDAAGSVGSESRDRRIADLVYTLCDLFYGLRIRVEDHVIAYRFFETLNERGLELSQSDLIRNVVLEHAESVGPATHDKALNNWAAMLDALEEQDALETSEFVQFSYASRQATVKAEKLFDQISQDLRSASIEADQLTSELAMDAMYWNELRQGNKNYWTNAAEDSQSFILEIKPIWKKHSVPLLLRIAERFDKKERKSELERALFAVECFLFREGTINSTSISDLARVFGNAARVVGDPNQPAEKFIDILKEASPDGPFKENFSVASAKGRLAFYIAWRLEKYVLGAGQFDLSSLNPAKQSRYTHLEHILPKKPDGSWDGIEEHDDFAEYLDRLGNHLILDGKLNSSIKNGSIQKKMRNPENSKKDYASQNLRLPQQVVAKADDWLHEGKWTFQSIKDRQQFLAENYALKVWRIDW